jgi:hypothetical protein
MAARWRLQSRRRRAKRDAEERGVGFRYPRRALFFARWWSQQCTIAATHQGAAGLNQTNGSITQVVGFPGAFGNLSGTKQAFRDFAVRAAIHPRIERAKCERQSTATLHGKYVQRRSRWTVVQRSPEPPRGMCTKFKVAIEWKLDRIGFGDDWCFPEPHAVFDAAQKQHGVPAIGRLPQFSRGQFVQLEADPSVRAERQRRKNRDHRRQDLRRPEHYLFRERLVGVSCENTAPISDGTRHSQRRSAKRRDGPVDSSDCDADIPRQIRSFLHIELARSRSSISNQTQTFASPLLREIATRYFRLSSGVVEMPIMHRAMHEVDLRC